MDSKQEETTNTAGKSTILQTTTTRQKSAQLGTLPAITKVPSGSPQNQTLKDADHVVNDEAASYDLVPTALLPDQISKEGKLASQNIQSRTDDNEIGPDNGLMSSASDVPINTAELLDESVLQNNAQAKDKSSSSVPTNIVNDSPTKPHVVCQVPNAITPADSVIEDTTMGTETRIKNLISSNSHDGIYGNNIDSKKSFLPSADASNLDKQASNFNPSSQAENPLVSPYISSLALSNEYEKKQMPEAAMQSASANNSDREIGSEGVEIYESLPNTNTENVSSHQVKLTEESTLSSLMETVDTPALHKDENRSSSEATSSLEVLNLSSNSNTSPPLHAPPLHAPPLHTPPLHASPLEAVIDAQNVVLIESMRSPNYTSSNPKFAKRASGSAVKRVGEATESVIDARDGSRKPLTDLYGDYLCDATDTCLEDARLRLKTALSQTYMLQKAFTDRLYDKYRVCLRPPRTTDEVINSIRVDPISSDERLRIEIDVIRDEKEVERKEAALINAEMAASKVTAALLGGVDNAEQLMYYTAGLNLVILPEENVPDEHVKNYHDRGPTNPGTGQRVRNISQAAAVAGEVMLDRTRKAVVMRADRKRRRRVQFMPNDIQAHHGNNEFINNDSKPLAISTAARRNDFAAISLSQSKLSSKSTSKSTVTLPSFASTKFRPLDATPSLKGTSISSNIPTNIQHPALSLTEATITSLDANHDELMSENCKPTASTAWLQQHSIRLLNNSKTTNQLAHAHIQSEGGGLHHGLGHAQSSGSGIAFQSTLPSILKSILRKSNHELPRRPTAEERVLSKPLAVLDLKNVLTERTRLSLESIIDICAAAANASTPSGSIPLKLTSQVGLLCSMQANDEEIVRRSSNPQMGGMKTSKLFSSRFTFSVLHAVGLFQTTSSQVVSTGNISLNNKALIPPFTSANNKKLPWTDPVIKLTEQIEKLDCRVSKIMIERKLPYNKDWNKLPQTTLDALGNNPHHISDSKQSKDPRPYSFLSTEKEDDDAMPIAKRMRSSSSPGQNSSTTERLHKLMNESTNSQQPPKTTQENSTMAPPGSSQATDYSPRIHQTQPYAYRWSVADTTLFRNQLSAPYMHHPAAGDLARYLGNFQPRRPGYEFFVQQASQSQLMTTNTNRSDSLRYPFAVSESDAPHAPIGREQQQAGTHSRYSVHQSFIPSLVPHNSIMRTFPTYQQPPWGMTNMYPLGTQVNNLKSEHNQMPISTNQIQRRTEVESSVAPHFTSSIADKKSHEERGEYMTDRDQSGTSLQPQTQNFVNGAEGENDAAGVKTADIVDKTSTNTNNLVLFTPKAPERLPNGVAELIRLGKYHEALPLLNDYSEMFLSLEYLMAVGAAVPIPKVMITILLKEHMTGNTFRQYGMNSMAPIPREIITSVVSIWLWSNHENNFQQAFTKSGRVDVDRECKMLVHHSLIIATKALSREIEESIATRTGVFAEAATARNFTDTERAFVMKSVELNTALTVSKALSEEMQYCQNIDIMLPNIHDAVALLDEARCVAFRVKAVERTLLASLLSKEIMIDNMFADAYTSSLVRSGEAYGHGDLFEVIQNEDAKASAMIPYDIFTDETGTWEDPNRPENGFRSSLNGKQLIRRAHARAMFHMSLKRLQVHNNIGGGANSFGPYGAEAQVNGTGSDNIFADKRAPPLPSPRPGLKRKISSILEIRIPVGTGSAQAKSVAVYEPKHIVSSIELNSSSLPNAPYGMHSVIESRKRVTSGITTSDGHPIIKKLKSDAGTKLDRSINDAVARSTHEVKWGDVISGFHLVKLPKKTSGSKNALPVLNQNAHDRKIFAPIFRNVSSNDFIDDEDESDTEEDITESSIIHRHQIVLDKMRENLNHFNEERKKQQTLRKNVHGK